MRPASKSNTSESSFWLSDKRNSSFQWRNTSSEPAKRRKSCLNAPAVQKESLKESIRMCTYESSASRVWWLFQVRFLWGCCHCTSVCVSGIRIEYGIDCNKRDTPTWQVTHLQYLDEGMVPNNTAYQSTKARLSHSSCTYQHLTLQIWQINPTHAGHDWGECQTFNGISNHSAGCCFLGDLVTNFLSTLKCSCRYFEEQYTSRLSGDLLWRAASTHLGASPESIPLCSLASPGELWTCKWFSLSR